MTNPVKEKPLHSSKNTLDAIVRSAATEFAAHGLDGAKMDDIARRARITKQLIYHYYGSKEELYIAVLEHLGEIAIVELRTDDDRSVAPTDSLRSFLNRIFDFHCRFPFFCAFLIDQNLHNAAHINRKIYPIHLQALIETLERIFDRGIELGEFRGDVEPRLFFATAVTQMRACFCDGNTLSLCLNRDIKAPEGIALWREYSVEFLLSGLRRAR